MATSITTTATLPCLLLFLLLALNSPIATGVGICDLVLPLTPCLTATPSDACCKGAAIVEKELKIPGGKKVVCECIKILVSPLPLAASEGARDALMQCNVDLPVPGPGTNCHKL